MLNNPHKRVLIVEDNSAIREMLKLGLEIEDYEVLEAVDGLDALKVLKTVPLPDLILLDMLMPRMNGWEFVSEIKKDFNDPISKIPVIVVSATSEKVQRIPGEIQEIVRKPIDLEELYDKMRRYQNAP